MTTAPDPTDLDDDETPPAPDELLAILGQKYTRAMAEPTPADPAVFGWQMQTAGLAILAARTLYALNEQDPHKAAQIAAWFHGPLGDGPNPAKCSTWLEFFVARSFDTLYRWEENGRQAAAEAALHAMGQKDPEGSAACRALTEAARVLDEAGNPLGAEEVRRLAAPPTQGPEQEEEAAETDEQRVDRLETERHHAAGDHEYCGPTCEVAFPSEALRNTILYRAIPGSPRMLDELLRRAREQGDADLATILVDDKEGIDGPCDCGEGAVHYTAADCPFEKRRQAGGVTVKPEEYTVTAVPDEVSPDAHLWALKVRHHGGGRWAVQHGEHECLGADGEWAPGVREYDRGDEWLAAHRFDLETALDLAREAAPHVTVNGFTVAGVLARKQGGAE